MAVAAIPAPADHGELAELPWRQHAIGDGDAQHVSVQLQIEAIAQAQGAELVLGQLAGEPSLNLLAELRHTLTHEGVVELVITVHRTNPWSEWSCARRGCARVPRLQPARRRAARPPWDRRRRRAVRRRPWRLRFPAPWSPPRPLRAWHGRAPPPSRRQGRGRRRCRRSGGWR